MCGAGSPGMKDGTAIHMFACNASMKDEAFYNADGDLMIVPMNDMTFRTELGVIKAGPKEVVVI